MKSIRLFPILILFGCVFVAWPLSSFSQILEQTFSENLADFSISTPNPQWTFAPRSITPGPLRATLRFQTSVDQFIPNVTVRVTAVFNPQTKLKDLIEEDLKGLPQEIEILSKETIRQGSVEGFEIQLRDPKAGVRFIQWIFLAKDKNFVVTGAAKESAWPRFEGDIKKILNSFEIR
jgi:hypothetical protein